jgi:hypothetical protein
MSLELIATLAGLVGGGKHRSTSLARCYAVLIVITSVEARPPSRRSRTALHDAEPAPDGNKVIEDGL